MAVQIEHAKHPPSSQTKPDPNITINETPSPVLEGAQGETEPVTTHKTASPDIDAANTVLHRSLHPHDLPARVTHADGLYLYLENGTKFLDATGGAAVACLGHNHPLIKQAIISQLDRVAYTATVFYSTSAAE